MNFKGLKIMLQIMLPYDSENKYHIDVSVPK